MDSPFTASTERVELSVCVMLPHRRFNVWWSDPYEVKILGPIAWSSETMVLREHRRFLMSIYFLKSITTRGRHITLLEPIENPVDRKKRLGFDIRLYRAVYCKGVRLRHVFSRPDERSSDRKATRPHIEQGNRELPALLH